MEAAQVALGIDLIIRKVLEYSARSTKDLLQLKLVNSQWNSIAIDILTCKGYTKVLLNPQNWNDYFLLTQIHPYSIIPSFPLNVCINEPPVPATLHQMFMNLQVAQNLTRHNFVHEMLKPKNIISLQSISNIKYLGRQESVKEEDVWDLILACANTLENLKFAGGHPNNLPNGTTRRVNSIYLTMVSNNMNLTFPNLAKVYYDMRLPQWNDSFELLMELINSSPRLRTMKLIGKLPLLVKAYDGVPVDDFNAQMSGLFDRMLPTRRNLLTTMEIPLLSDTVRDYLYGMEFPGLKRLKLHQRASSYSLQNDFYYFLKKKCPSLKSLELFYCLHDLVHCNVPLRLFPPIPHHQLTGVKKFALYVETDGLGTGTFSDYWLSQLWKRGGQLIVDNMSYSSKVFPNLTSLSTDVTVLTNLPALVASEVCRFYRTQNGDDGLDILFPNVTSLSIVANIGAAVCSFQTQPMISRLRSFFPAVSQLIFHKIEPSYSMYPSPLKMLLKLMVAFSVRRLDVNSYHKDWLTDIFRSDDPVVSAFREGLRNSLEVLTLKLREQFLLQDGATGDPSTKPDLMTWLPEILQTFPNLSDLQIEDKIFKKYGYETDFSPFRNRLLKELDVIGTQFPQKKFTLL